MKSNFEYAAIAEMRDEIEALAKEIRAIFEVELCQNVVNSIRSHYEGSAADTYKARFTQYGNQAMEALNAVMTKINSALDTEAVQHKSQDQALSE